MWSRIKDPFAKPLDVLVVGPSGAGKTSFIQTLCGISVAGLPRNPFSPKTLEIAGHAVNFIELSDEENYSLKEMQRSKPLGVIIVVANGYYANRLLEYRGINDFDRFGDPFKFTDDFYKFPELAGKNVHLHVLSFREGELRFLDNKFDMYLRTFYERNSRPLEWVLTIVNKADLWWDKRADVDKFYRNTYQPALLKVLKKYHMTHGAMPIRKYFSSRIQRFFGNVYPSSAFDDDDRWRLNDGLKETMAEALSNSKLG